MNIKTVSLNYIIETLDYDQALPSTDQIEKFIRTGGYNLVSINNVIITAEDFLSKLARVELVLLKQGDLAATKRWYNLGLPELSI